MSDQFTPESERLGDLAGDKHAGTPDPLAMLLAVLRRWKLVTITTTSALAITYGAMRFVPSVYKSTAEILVYDPQRQIDSAVQKPISPFVDALSYDSMSTEIKVLKSKSVALRVARELHLDEVPEFQPVSRVLASLEWLGLSSLAKIYDHYLQHTEMTTADKLDQAADALLASVDAWSDAYIIFISVSAHNPVMAQRLAETIAMDYLANQREARQEALQHVAGWLKGRVDELRSRILETESSIEALKAQSGVPGIESETSTEQQIGALNKQLISAREQAEGRRSRLEQARRIIEQNADIQSISELTDSAILAKLRSQESELSSRLESLRSQLGENHAQVIGTRAALAVVEKQISTEAGHILGNMQNAYDIALRQEQAVEASLRNLSSQLNSAAYNKLQQLRRTVDADRGLYAGYLSQYNEISERQTLQNASARIISPASLPRSPSSSRRKMFYMAGGVLGLGGGAMLALFLELLRPGIKTCDQAERSLGLPVVGIIPGMGANRRRDNPSPRRVDTILREPRSQISQAVHAMRIGLELGEGCPKVVLVTSAVPAEGKSTTALLLAASSASSGKRTILLEGDLHQPSSASLNGSKRQLGLAEFLLGNASISDVTVHDPMTGFDVIPAGSVLPNAADRLLSQRMRDLVAVLRKQYDYIVIDSPPLLPVVDALVLAIVADKVLVVVAWDDTSRASISEAFKLLRPERHRVAGIVLNKVDLTQIPQYGYGYSRYHSRPIETV